MVPLLLAVLLATATADESALAPVLTGRPAEAGALLEAGRPAEALEALGRASRPEARLLRLLALEALERPAQVLRAAEGLERRLPAVADRILAARARALVAMDRHAEAAAAWGLVPPGSLLAGEARVERARALARAGRQGEALATLDALVGPDGEQGSAPALLLGAELRARGGPEALSRARALLIECWAGRPGAPEAEPCREALEALPGAHGAPPPPEAQVRRAEGLLEQNRHEEAARLVEPLVGAGPGPAPDQPLACRAAAALGRALRRARENGRAARVLGPVVERCIDGEVRTRALYVLATAVAALGERDEAVALYRRFAREAGDSRLADDALFSAAALLAREGRLAEAREALQTLVRDHPRGDRRDEARFRLAWLERRAGDAEAAQATLLAIEEDAGGRDPYERGRAAYWRARLLAERGPDGVAAARAIWRELVEDGPADYYALLARARLAGEAGVLLPEPIPAAPGGTEPLPLGRLGEDRHLAAGVLLLRLGLTSAAAEELGAVDLPAGEALPVLALAELLDRAGDHAAAHRLVRLGAREVLRLPPQGPSRRAWEVAYPPAHGRLVRRHAPAAGVPAELLQALMREESALDPEAVSVAGAVGLTQLMLPTAREVARRLGLRRPGRADLLDPETNIRLGAAYLGRLLRSFDGAPALAIAAYNAGATAVGRWRRAGAGLELDEFVEEIPYDETRGYVQRVLRSWAAYRLLAGSAGAGAAKPPAGEGGGAGGPG
jgi:soluble lytic murein transglycosylase